jgi:alanyl-tRNA synthetase
MNTERLYYYDPYLREFTGRVLAHQTLNDRPAVALDRTAFYPTGGGQPNDTGTLDSVPVVDVVSDAERGLIWHVLGGAAVPAGENVRRVILSGPERQSPLHGQSSEESHIEVTGVLDWPRRFDHMQQHTGQHVLSQAFIQTADAETVAFHLGATVSTIDLNRADLGPADLAAAAATANAVIDDGRPVTATFVSQADLANVPLRRPPKVTEAIRVVQVADYDWSACGGTHVANTAQIGLLKIVASERRGSETRVTFLCGGRARADYARLQTLAEGLVARFTVGQPELLDAVDRLLAEHKTVRKELAELEGQWAVSTAAALWVGAQPHGPWRVVAQALDCPLERARRVAQTLRGHPGAVVLLGVRGERPQLIFTRGDDVPLDAGSLLRSAAAAGGGRGGGRPDWAQGGVPTVEALEKALAAAVAALPTKDG